MPLPHICIEITWRVGSGSTTQDVFVWLPSTPVINEPSRLECGQNIRAPDSGRGLQILPRLQGENWASDSEVVGFMMNLEPALQVVVLKGQQALDIVQPSVHFGNHISRVNVVQKDQASLHRARVGFSDGQWIAARRGKVYNVQSRRNCDRSHAQ